MTANAVLTSRNSFIILRIVGRTATVAFVTFMLIHVYSFYKLQHHTLEIEQQVKRNQQALSQVDKETEERMSFVERIIFGDIQPQLLERQLAKEKTIERIPAWHLNQDKQVHDQIEQLQKKVLEMEQQMRSKEPIQ